MRSTLCFLRAWTALCVCALVLMTFAIVPDSAQARSRSSAAAPWQVAQRLDLIPTPRRMALTGERYDLRHFRLIIPRDARLARTGAHAINRRVEQLGGEPLPISHKPVAPTQEPSVPKIVLASGTSELGRAITSATGIEPPGEQGYVIRFTQTHGHARVLAIGSDPLGTLYAAMTLRRLIQPGKSGDPALLGASVRDWPMYKRRCIGFVGNMGFGDLHEALGDPEKEQALVRRYARRHLPRIRYMARLKINYAFVREGLLDQIVRTEDPALRRLKARCVRAMTDLARRYGIRCRYIFDTNIKRDISQEQWTGCVKTRGGARWYCWTADRIHRRRARRFARVAKRTGIGNYVLHVVDNGGFDHPEQWQKRCDRCRRVYGDDHARATADMLLTYYHALKKVAPKCDFEAVPYPYHYEWTVPGFPEHTEHFGKVLPHAGWVKGLGDPRKARRVARRVTRLHHGLEAALPDTILATFREGGAAAFEGAAELWAGHPIDLWVYFGRFNNGSRPLWLPQRRFVSTWYRPEHRDFLFDVMACFGGPIQKAGAAEYAWNPDVPDAQPTFQLRMRFYKVAGHTVTDYQRHSLIPRALRRLWGEGGMAFLQLYTTPVSFRYIADPHSVSHGSDAEALENPYRFYEEMTAALQSAQPKVNAWMQSVLRGENPGAKTARQRGYGFHHACELYLMTNLGAIKGRIRTTLLDAQQLAERGRCAQAARKLREMIELLPTLAQKAKQVKRDYREATGHEPHGRLSNYDPLKKRSLLKKALRNVREQGDPSSSPQTRPDA